MSEIRPVLVLDTCAEVCPANFIKTKMALAKINTGEILEVHLDRGDPLRNVSRGMKQEGHRIIKIENMNDKCKLYIQK